MTFQDIAKMLQGVQDPRQLTMNLLQTQMGNTPMGENLLSLAEQGNMQEIEKIARNICSQKGVDYDKEFSAFKQILGVK